jgi:hypothetical protein
LKTKHDLIIQKKEASILRTPRKEKKKEKGVQRRSIIAGSGTGATVAHTYVRHRLDAEIFGKALL